MLDTRPGAPPGQPGSPYIRSPFLWPLLGSTTASLFSVFGLLAHYGAFQTQVILLFGVSILTTMSCFTASAIWAFIKCHPRLGREEASKSDPWTAPSDVGHYLRTHQSNAYPRSGFLLLEVRRHFFVRVRCPQNWNFRKHLEGLVVHNRSTLETYSDGLLSTVSHADIGRSLHEIAAVLGREFQITLLVALFSAPRFPRTITAREGWLVMQFDTPAVGTYTEEQIQRELEPYHKALLRITEAAKLLSQV